MLFGRSISEQAVDVGALLSLLLMGSNVLSSLFAGRNVTVECPESIARRFPSRDLGGWMRAEGIERLVVDFDEDEVVGLDVGFEVEGRKRGCEVGEGLRKRFCSGF